MPSSPNPSPNVGEGSKKWLKLLPLLELGEEAGGGEGKIVAHRVVTVNTTVQPEAVAFPTNAKLYEKARRALVRVAKDHAVKLRQSYARLGKQALFKQSHSAKSQNSEKRSLTITPRDADECTLDTNES